MLHIHFMGIGGSGASGVAAIAHAQGYKVTGCDKQPVNEFTTHFLKDQLLKGHSKDHLEGVDVLAITPAITSLDPNNEELLAAKKQGIKVLTWQEFMGKYLQQDKFVIATCGTHGKSTTTAMIAKVLEDAGLDPTVEVGTVIPKWGTNFRVGKSKYFVTEADEFNDNFLSTTPDIAVVTTIEMDHPEYFSNFEDYKGSFGQFLTKTKNTIVANISDPGVGEVMKWLVKHQHLATVLDYSRSDFNLQLQIPGSFNLMNAKAAFQVGLLLEINSQHIKKSLESFKGVSRRFELLGKYHDALVYSDFGHHPTEIKVTLDAAKEKFPNKNIQVIFQPHMFSRTQALFADFVKVLKNAPVDQINILDIYPSREIDRGLVSSEQLVSSINKPSVNYALESDVLDQIKQKNLTDTDVLIFLGAGNIHQLAKKLLSLK